MLEVSTHGRVRSDGKLLCKERHGQFGRVKWKGKRYDVARVVRRAVHGPSGKPDWTEHVLSPALPESSKSADCERDG